MRRENKTEVGGKLDLTFDVDLAESNSFCQLKKIPGLASKKDYSIIFLLQKFLSIVINDELAGFCIRLKAKFFGDKP